MTTKDEHPEFPQALQEQLNRINPKPKRENPQGKPPQIRPK